MTTPHAEAANAKVLSLEAYIKRPENQTLRARFTAYNKAVEAAEKLRQSLGRELEQPRHKEAKALLEGVAELLGGAGAPEEFLSGSPAAHP